LMRLLPLHDAFFSHRILVIIVVILQSWSGLGIRNGKDLRRSVGLHRAANNSLATDDEKSIEQLLKESTEQHVNSKLHTLVRLTRIEDEKSFPYLKPRLNSLTQRMGIGEPRLASPFEHICGGARPKVDSAAGNDGPTQFLSFSNAGQFPRVGQDCAQPWDIGQRRVAVSAESVKEQGGLVVDLSVDYQAWQWCYYGGCLTSSSGQEYCFKGAKDIEPWPYICATRAYRVQHPDSNISAPNAWWNEETRKFIAQSCVVWATRAKEVLVMPNPDKLTADRFAKRFVVKVQSHRPPADRLCVGGFRDHCVSLSPTVCCSEPESPRACAPEPP